MRPLAALICGLALLLSACSSDDPVDPVAGPSTSTESDRGTASGKSDDEDSTTDTSDSPTDTEVPAVLEFTSETVSGESFDGADLAGQPTVFWFWAPWCPTCLAQIPVVSDVAETYGAEVNVVGIGSLSDAEAIAEFASSVSPDVTLLSDPDGALWRDFGVTAQSTYIVLDEDGTEEASGYLDDGELVDLVGDLVD